MHSSYTIAAQSPAPSSIAPSPAPTLVPLSAPDGVVVELPAVEPGILEVPVSVAVSLTLLVLCTPATNPMPEAPAMFVVASRIEVVFEAVSMSAKERSEGLLVESTWDDLHASERGRPRQVMMGSRVRTLALRTLGRM